MEKDKYFKKLEKEYIDAIGNFPTVKQLSDYFYERKIVGRDYLMFLKRIGFNDKNKLIEINKGNLDSILVDNNFNDINLISDFICDISLKNINLINGNIILNKNNELKICTFNNIESDIDFNSSIIFEGVIKNKDISVLSKMYYDNLDLYVGCYGFKSDKNYIDRVNKLIYIRDLIKDISNIDLDIYDNDTKNIYQKVLFYRDR